jgi:hypothetical protein
MKAPLEVPRDFEAVTLTREVRRVIRAAHKADCQFFERNPLRLTYVRAALAGEFEGAPPHALVAVRRMRRGGFHKACFVVTKDGGVLIDWASESVAAQIFGLLTENNSREIKERQRGAVAQLLASMPAAGRA